ncbi:rootletin [Clonorchis sinensis]|uniref:Rootletin n=1 Tax=Clonorchis sinensis TaxID=79923 RepID=G7YKW5_CLOSI|nr:rootletin [Clonorchis sinensis]
MRTKDTDNFIEKIQGAPSTFLDRSSLSDSAGSSSPAQPLNLKASKKTVHRKLEGKLDSPKASKLLEISEVCSNIQYPKHQEFNRHQTHSRAKPKFDKSPKQHLICAGDAASFEEVKTNKNEECSSQSDSEVSILYRRGTVNERRQRQQKHRKGSTAQIFNKNGLFREESSSSDKEYGESGEEDSVAAATAPNPPNATWSSDQRDYRRRLDDELAVYKQKLASYQEGQQKQSDLVQRLQAKVIQYKEKCRTLELKLQLAEAENQTRKAGMEENTAEYEATLQRLDEEQQRASTLVSVNNMLREQLDQTTQANQTLSCENRRIRDEASRFKEILERREAEWRDEEAAFNEYFTTEHGRLLTLWRAVVACRRQFVDVKGQVEREISSARADVNRLARASQAAFENFAANVKNTEAQQQTYLESERNEKKNLERQMEQLKQTHEKTRQQMDQDIKSLTKRLNETLSEMEETKYQLADKERTLACLQRLRTGQSLCNKREGSDIIDPNSRALVEEIQSMQQAIRELSQSVMNDDVAVGRDCHRSRSRSPCYASVPAVMQPCGGVSRAGAYGRTGSPPPPVNVTSGCYWGDSTLSAIQAAMSKRGMQLADLNNKLGSLREQYEAVRVRLEECEGEKLGLEEQLLSLKTNINSEKQEREEVKKELQRCKAQIQAMTNQKAELEKTRQQTTEQVTSLRSDLEKSKEAQRELQLKRDKMEEELTDLRMDAEKNVKEAERRQRCIEGLEERLAAAKEETSALRESLQCVRLEAEIKATERADLQEALSKGEAKRAELEGELTNLRAEQQLMQDRIGKQQARIEEIQGKRQAAQAQLRSLEAEHTQLDAELRNVEAERISLRDRVIELESQKNELLSEKNRLTQSLTLSEAARERLEEGVSVLNREKFDLTEQLNAVTRHKNGLTSELAQKCRDIDRLREVIARVNNEKEELTREKGDLTTQLRGLERTYSQTCDLLAAAKKECQTLETDCYQAKQRIEQLETQKELLESGNQELTAKRDNLLSEIKRIQADAEQDLARLSQAREKTVQHCQRREHELQVALQAAREAGENEANALRHQIIEAREAADKQLRELADSHKEECQKAKKEFLREKEAHAVEISTLQRERDETALAFEAEKQAILSGFEQERTTFSERISAVQAQQKSVEGEMSRVKREAQARHERDEAARNELAQELKDFHRHFEETCAFHEQTTNELQAKIVGLNGQCEEALKNNEELQTKLRLLDEARENLQRTLSETSRRLHDADAVRETLRKEIVDLRRTIAEVQGERDNLEEAKGNLAKRVRALELEKTDSLRALNAEKQQVAALEEQKCSNHKEITELKAGLRSSEKTRLEIRRDLQEARRQLKDLNAEKERLAKDLSEIQARIGKEEEKCGELRSENAKLKQRISELDAAK